MAGLLVLRPDLDWSAGGGLFYWTVDFLADRLSDPEAAAYLREISRENLGSLWLAELPADARAQAVELLRDQLVPAGDRELPGGEGKAAVLDRLRELADMARRLG
ncbi:hypothetical protein GCM10010112_18170 [Actinoplanes lobatus]|uniref:Uncharacterized protein n=1 Tax=Actinoplanes lobatus TaxID=113568 RepID=A0A7W7MDJ3_9ACTN|nr:hypothetical protein [Actinoplanes lobatus]MBB4746223.1 hypothetical protein [Actinoplanes lobatus]GGN61240.1 hypothetical protein GCM10010112_18170 [Actinoplanes lobatus]GIE41431.1 hypothetical protein Alo02nite_43290 [Actinoplanes lobatus]